MGIYENIVTLYETVDGKWLLHHNDSDYEAYDVTNRPPHLFSKDAQFLIDNILDESLLKTRFGAVVELPVLDRVDENGVEYDDDSEEAAHYSDMHGIDADAVAEYIENDGPQMLYGAKSIWEYVRVDDTVKK